MGVARLGDNARRFCKARSMARKSRPPAPPHRHGGGASSRPQQAPVALLQQAMQALQLGHAVRAEGLLQEVLRLDAQNFDALHLLGLSHLRRKDHRAGLAWLERAAALQPGFAPLHNNMGIAWRELGDPQAALACYDRVLALQPGHADAHNNRGNALRDLGRPQDALAAYEQALALKPDNPQAWHNRGLALRDLARADAALQSQEQALALDPGYADAHVDRGIALEALQRADEALAAYAQALQLRPDHEAAWLHRASLLEDVGRPAEALAHCDEVIRRSPGSAEAWNSRGNALESLGRLDDALASYRRALELAPSKADVLANCGNVLLRLKRPADAAAAFDELLALRPGHPYALGSQLTARLHACDWTGYTQRVAEVEQAVARGEAASTPFEFLAISADAALQRRCTESWVADRHAVPQLPGLAPAAADDRRIRIAYVSADLHDHATAHLMAGLFERHDRSRFEVWAVSLGPERPSAMRERLKAAFEHFVDARTMSDRAVALAMRGWGIDVAIDLKGHTQDSRPDIFALRAAPVQVGWLGSPGTHGMAAVDYLLADATVVPPGAEAFYREQVVRLPGCYQVNDPARTIAEATPTRADCGLPPDGFVFCCFNHVYKITPPVFAVWMRLLQAVPASVLWLLEDTPDASANLRREAARHGVDADRLVFAARRPLPEHLARHRLADLFLDTAPVNAHTTASDALWTGLPVLTCPGQAFASRVAASLLHALGMDEFIAADLADYEARALALARDPGSLRDRVPRARLADVDGFRLGLEAAFAEMFRRSRAGQASAAFDVPAQGPPDR
jgi:protein O-GlcNAc transferase